MSVRATSAAPGSVGTVETQFLDLPDPLQLDNGASLDSLRIAYETYGKLAPARDNVVLVCHALSGDAHAAGYSGSAEYSGTPRTPGVLAGGTA
jgi:homoserine O-acetyltransferase